MSCGDWYKSLIVLGELCCYVCIKSFSIIIIIIMTMTMTMIINDVVYSPVLFVKRMLYTLWHVVFTATKYLIMKTSSGPLGDN